jgi:peptidoglycan pentaglycine glycine transferase (the first glycine)
MWQQIEDKQHWNTLVASKPNAQFLQSWEWGEFQNAVGKKVLRLCWKDQVLIQLIKINLGLGKFYWYAPRGPIEINPSEKRKAILELEEKFKNTNAVFTRVDPQKSDFWPPSPEKEISSIQPRCVRVIDISIPKDEYFKKGVHTKTRYNIGLSERKGVEVREGNIVNFLNLNLRTSNRNNFTPHPNKYYVLMEKILSKNPDKWTDCSIKIWEATYKGTVVASNIIIYFGDTMTYAHGGSSDKFRNIMAPYLLRWKIIEDAIARGYHHHDLGGVNPDDKNHPAYKKSWEGITKFKEGFGGVVHCYPQSFDLIYNPSWYRVYTMLKKIRRTF